TINKIIEVLSTTLDCMPSDIHVYSLKEIGEEEPAAIIIQKAPLAALNKVGMSLTQFLQIVQKAAAGGVRVVSINLEGTFQFSSKPSVLETDHASGFSDVGQTIGGYLGAVISDAEDVKLPI
ncbi:hypothetical protein, partial [Acinetobacter baumannii]|uniref:hypothetical protein n=1 Tax=Acinetobacter baumannii TaxID=470 RepID=UPI000A90F32E